MTPTRKYVSFTANKDGESSLSRTINRIGDGCFEIIYATL